MIQKTQAQYNLPAFRRRLAYPANRGGVAEHSPEPSVRKSIEVDLALIDQYDALIDDLELMIVREAKRHDAATLLLGSAGPCSPATDIEVDSALSDA